MGVSRHPRYLFISSRYIECLIHKNFSSLRNIFPPSATFSALSFWSLNREVRYSPDFPRPAIFTTNGLGLYCRSSHNLGSIAILLHSCFGKGTRQRPSNILTAASQILLDWCQIPGSNRQNSPGVLIASEVWYLSERSPFLRANGDRDLGLD